MMPQIQLWFRDAVVPLFASGVHSVLEIGSMDVNGNVRFMVPSGVQYVGLDMRPGPNVDVVMNAHDIRGTSLDRVWDMVICLETLEHDDRFWETVDVMRDIVGRYLVVSTPTIGFKYHPHPKDYYRFTEDFYRDVLFRGMDVLDLRQVVDHEGNPSLCGVAMVPESEQP